MPSAREALLRTVAYFDVIDYAPTWAECCAWYDWSGSHGFESVAPPSSAEFDDARAELERDGRLEAGFGRFALPGRLATLAAKSMERTAWFPRKVRRARRVARWLLRNPNVRFVALANTTALAHARHFGDLDFFIIVRSGSLWSSRLLASGPYKLLGALPSEQERADAVCFSYFVTDDALDLSGHMLAGDDPYFRFWFLSLLPLADDGVGRELWEANRFIRSRHPNAEPWIVPPDVEVRPPRVRIPKAFFAESFAKGFQQRWFPNRIRERQNRDTSVLVSDRVLKFHVDDGREAYRDAYRVRLQSLGLV